MAGRTDFPLDRNSGSVQKRGRPDIPSVSYQTVSRAELKHDAHPPGVLPEASRMARDPFRRPRSPSESLIFTFVDFPPICLSPVLLAARYGGGRTMSRFRKKWNRLF
ncbi:MAG: hypothetical protein OXE85_07650 [Roseovarius sp.]|nr:hypothetical protein [Roseovarius sp.]